MDFEKIIKNKLEANEFKMRYWSYIIEVENEGKRYYIKIPKRNKFSENIFLDIQDEINQKTALNEYRYLTKLYFVFSENENPKLNVVKPIEYNKKYNAIITEEFNGTNLYKLSTIKSKSIIKYYSLAGEWLDTFHKNKKSFTDCSIETQDYEPFSSIDYLQENSYKKKYIDHLHNKIENFKNMPLADDIILEGFEIRNLLVYNDSLCFLDPTVISKGYHISDIARFFVSIDMLYWGRIDAYFVKGCNDFKQIFLDSYMNGRDYDTSVLSYYIIKYLLIRWKQAYFGLNQKNKLHIISKPFISRYYVDYLFSKWINMYIEDL